MSSDSDAQKNEIVSSKHPKLAAIAAATKSVMTATGLFLLGRMRALLKLRGRKLVRILLLSTLVTLIVTYSLAESNRRPIQVGRETTLDQVIKLGQGHQVLIATLYDFDSRVVVRTAVGNYWASYPHSDSETSSIVAAMQAGGTPVRVDKQSSKARWSFYEQFLLPILVLANLFGLLFVSGRGEGGASEYTEFSKVRGGRGVENQSSGILRRKGAPHVTFADIGGAQSAVVELAEVVDYLKDPTKFERVGALPPKGVLLFGPPGCGKTLLARAVAGEANVPFYSLSGSEFVESLVGVGAARVRDLFERVRRAAPAIVFIDELDAAGRKRGAGVGGGNDEREQTLNQILVEMDGFATQSGIVVIGATNRPDILDPALLRPGRFDRHITVDRPDVEGRFDILRLYSANRPLAPNIDLERLARRTPGFTGAELANVWNEAALLTVRSGKEVIGVEELDEAVQRVIAGPKRSSESLSPQERELIVTHESGHAIVAAALRGVDAVERVSIARRGIGLGHAATLRDDRIVLRRSEMLDQMVMSVAGYAAENVFFGEPSTGSEADIERATELARELAGRFGFTEGIGPVRVAAKDSEVFLGRDLAAIQMVSQTTLAQLDAEIRSLIEAAIVRATALVQLHRAAIASLAEALFNAETIEHDALQPYLKRIVQPSRNGSRSRKRTVVVLD